MLKIDWKNIKEFSKIHFCIFFVVVFFKEIYASGIVSGANEYNSSDFYEIGAIFLLVYFGWVLVFSIFKGWIEFSKDE